MKKIVLVTAVFASQFSWAHGDHPPRVANCKLPKACTEGEISEAAGKAVKIFAAKDPKNSSWAMAKVSKVELRDFAKGKEWVAIFSDENKPEGQKSLFVYITQDGYLNGANYSGK